MTVREFTRTRSPEQVARDLFLEVGEVLLGTRWAEEFDRLNRSEEREEQWVA
jgi:hypothetical protein